MKIRDKVAYVYDIEVFRNVFHCTLLNTETEELHKFECSIRRNDMQEMCKFFLQPDIYLVGYNNIHYDNPIINYCIEFFSNSNYHITLFVNQYLIYQKSLQLIKIILKDGKDGNTPIIFIH